MSSDQYISNEVIENETRKRIDVLYKSLRENEPRGRSIFDFFALINLAKQFDEEYCGKTKDLEYQALINQFGLDITEVFRKKEEQNGKEKPVK
jgi:hypothetical protein